jgi:iron complex outermembrane receptor protein
VTAPAAPNPDRAIYTQQQAMHNNSYAAFAQTDWKFLPTWKLTTGLRYTYDILKGGEQYRELCFGLPACLGNIFGPIPPPAILGAFTPVNDITASARRSPIAPRLPDAVSGVRERLPAVRRDVGRTWARLALTHGYSRGGMDPDPNTLAYLKYSRGYKSGGFQCQHDFGQSGSQPEHLDAISGRRQEVFNRQFQVNGALFYYNYTDKQIPLTLPAGSGGPNISSIVNIPKAESYGVELETIWQPWGNLQFLGLFLTCTQRSR